MTCVARILIENVDDPAQKVVLLCGLDQEQKLVEGEWMGYWTDRVQTCPFVMTTTGLHYDGHAELHNFAKRPILMNELFTIAEQGESDGVTYRVRSVTAYSPR